nr:MAG: RNA-dependent RNA polymerase [Riboviria sp.]
MGNRVWSSSSGTDAIISESQIADNPPQGGSCDIDCHTEKDGTLDNERASSDGGAQESSINGDQHQMARHGSEGTTSDHERGTCAGGHSNGGRNADSECSRELAQSDICDSVVQQGNELALIQVTETDDGNLGGERRSLCTADKQTQTEEACADDQKQGDTGRLRTAQLRICEKINDPVSTGILQKVLDSRRLSAQRGEECRRARIARSAHDYDSQGWCCYEVIDPRTFAQAGFVHWDGPESYPAISLSKGQILALFQGATITLRLSIDETRYDGQSICEVREDAPRGEEQRSENDPSANTKVQSGVRNIHSEHRASPEEGGNKRRKSHNKGPKPGRKSQAAPASMAENQEARSTELRPKPLGHARFRGNDKGGARDVQIPDQGPVVRAANAGSAEESRIHNPGNHVQGEGVCDERRHDNSARELSVGNADRADLHQAATTSNAVQNPPSRRRRRPRANRGRRDSTACGGNLPPVVAGGGPRTKSRQQNKRIPSNSILPTQTFVNSKWLDYVSRSEEGPGICIQSIKELVEGRSTQELSGNNLGSKSNPAPGSSSVWTTVRKTKKPKQAQVGLQPKKEAAWNRAPARGGMDKPNRKVWLGNANSQSAVLGAVGCGPPGAKIPGRDGSSRSGNPANRTSYPSRSWRPSQNGKSNPKSKR